MATMPGHRDQHPAACGNSECTQSGNIPKAPAAATADEYNELKTDIANRGVMVPIEFDENGNVLDGHHRLKICNELGIKDYPKVIRAGMTENEKRTHARKLNMARRQLNREQKQELIREQLRETPELSDRQIAKAIGVSDKTVGSQRRDMESGAEIPHLENRQGADGKQYPRQLASRSATVHSYRRLQTLTEPHSAILTPEDTRTPPPLPP